MKILINNKDRTGELEPRIREALQTRNTRMGPDEIAPEIGALSLREAASEADYQERLIRLLRYRDNVDTLPFDIPHRGGVRGRCLATLKSFLWKLLRYQHDRMSFRQNLINSLYTSAIEFEREQRMSEIARLEARIEAMEKKKDK